MIIRAARPGDAAAICAISNPLIRDTLITFTTDLRDEAATAAVIEGADGAFLIAEMDGEVIGFANYSEFRKGPGYAHTREHSIQLSANARGQGIGRALMERLFDIARDQSVHVLVAGISGANPDAIAFHAALGFAEVGRMPEVGRKDGRWLDLILMQKTL